MFKEFLSTTVTLAPVNWIVPKSLFGFVNVTLPPVPALKTSVPFAVKAADCVMLPVVVNVMSPTIVPPVIAVSRSLVTKTPPDTDGPLFVAAKLAVDRLIGLAPVPTPFCAISEVWPLLPVEISISVFALELRIAPFAALTSTVLLLPEVIPTTPD